MSVTGHPRAPYEPRTAELARGRFQASRSARRVAIRTVLAFVLAAAGAAFSDDHDRPVVQVRMREQGDCHAGRMSWYGRSLNDASCDFIVLATVVSVGESVSSDGSESTDHLGVVQVDSILACPVGLQGQAFAIRTITGGSFSGLQAGDRAIVLLTLFEGQYAIPDYFHTNCGLGIRLPRKPLDGFDERQYLDLVISGRLGLLDQLPDDEVRLCLQVDAEGFYKVVVSRLEGEREESQRGYERAASGQEAAAARATAGAEMTSAVSRLAALWVGTEWDFNGMAEIPLTGSIACGYFVSTVLRDAGLRLERIRLAQQASEHIIKSLASEEHIRRFSNAPIDQFVDSVLEWGRGLYVVGLDIHTGFVIHDADGVHFVHSSYLEPQMVIWESALESPILRSSHYRVLGKLSEDAQLIRKWLHGEQIVTVTN